MLVDGAGRRTDAGVRGEFAGGAVADLDDFCGNTDAIERAIRVPIPCLVESQT